MHQAFKNCLNHKNKKQLRISLFLVIFCILLLISSKYVPGNFNMIVTAPHGGYLDVPNCSYRNFGCYINSQCYFNSTSTCTRDPANCDISTTKDAYTQEVARMVVQNITSLKGKTPHLVIMKCTR